jgi:hypothetical protein
MFPLFFDDPLTTIRYFSSTFSKQKLAFDARSGRPTKARNCPSRMAAGATEAVAVALVVPVISKQ